MKLKLFLTLALLMTICSLGMAQTKQAYAVLSNSDKLLTFYYDENMSSYKSGVYPIESVLDQEPQWHKPYNGSGENPNIIEKVEFKSSFQEFTPVSTVFWFHDQEKLATIEGLEYLNTSEVLSMYGMFFKCIGLSELNLSSFDTSKVVDMGCMFYWCYNLTSIVQDFDTHNVTSMASMFDGCESLSGLNLSNFDTSNVTDMSNMFYHCRQFYSFGLPSFDTKKVENMRYMFGDCINLKNLNLTSFDTSNVTDMTGMFTSCGKLVRLNLTGFDTRKVESMAAMFSDDDELSKIYVGDLWSTALLSESEISGYPNGWFNMFNGCDQLKGGEGTVYNSDYVGKEYAHVDQVDNPGYLSARPAGYVVYNEGVLTFYNDGKMDEKEGEKFVLPVEDEGYPAWSDYDELVTEVVFNNSFSQSRPVTMYYWFNYFSNLTTITGMNYLNTSKVTNMNSVFFECNKLKSIDVSTWDTSNVTDMFNLFSGCSQLKSINVSNWNTSNVTDMSSMFSMCKGLTTLDFNGWDTSNLTNTIYMFYSCHNLTTIYVGNGWNMDNVTSSNRMFQNCESIVGGAGTVYCFDIEELGPKYYQDKTFAHVDGGAENPGYLTAKLHSITTSLSEAHQDESNKLQTTSDEWFTIDGQKLNGKPSKKGVYINNGKKAVVN